MKRLVFILTAIGAAFLAGRRLTGARRVGPLRCKGLVITSATVQINTGVVTLTGRLKCTGSEGIVHIDPIVLSQKQANSVITGADEIGMDCGDPNASFTVVMDADEGQFRPGKATVSGKVLIGTQTIAVCPLIVRLKPASGN